MAMVLRTVRFRTAPPAGRARENSRAVRVDTKGVAHRGHPGRRSPTSAARCAPCAPQQAPVVRAAAAGRSCAAGGGARAREPAGAPRARNARGTAAALRSARHGPPATGGGSVHRGDHSSPVPPRRAPPRAASPAPVRPPRAHGDRRRGLRRAEALDGGGRRAAGKPQQAHAHHRHVTPVSVLDERDPLAMAVEWIRRRPAHASPRAGDAEGGAERAARANSRTHSVPAERRRRRGCSRLRPVGAQEQILQGSSSRPCRTRRLSAPAGAPVRRRSVGRAFPGDGARELHGRLAVFACVSAAGPPRGPRCRPSHLSARRRRRRRGRRSCRRLCQSATAGA